MNLPGLIWRQTKRDLAAGEIRLLLIALVLAVMAVTSVGLLTDRAKLGLQQEANRLLGGDAALRADTPIDDSIKRFALAQKLQVAQTANFPSMVQSNDQVNLSEIHAVDQMFPLRGSFQLRDSQGKLKTTVGGPETGTVWLSVDALRRLNIKLGDNVRVGNVNLKFAAVVEQAPDAALDYFNVAPRVYIAWQDLQATGLVQNGSRIGYRMVVAGNRDSVNRFVEQTRANLQRGQRLDTGDDARPEIRSALDRAGRFLGLAALVSLILAAVAIALAARRHTARHLDGSAIMRCLGASQRTIALLQCGELFLLGIAASTIGIALAWMLQAVLGSWLASSMGVTLPMPGYGPVLAGIAICFVVLLAFAVPPVLALRKVPALRVLREDIPVNEPSAWLVGLLGLSGLAALLWWQASSPVLGSIILAGILVTVLILAVVAWLLLKLLSRVRKNLSGPWRYGLANLSRHQAMTMAQVSALGLGLMVLLLLTFVRTDLLSQWQKALPSDAPNRFVINVQSNQIAEVETYLQKNGLSNAQLIPMVRARLLKVNNKERIGSDYADLGERAERMAEREFNLSTSATISSDNQITAGKFWSANHAGEVEMSVEEEFAKTLSWKLGDVVTFDIAGDEVTARVTSFRKVEWESFKPNFFVLISPGGIDDYSASYISAVHVAKDKLPAMDGLVRAFPNLSVIDIDAVLNQVRSTVDQVSRIVEAVFYFSILAGLLVLLAAVQASQDERMREAAVMRVLGASQKQLRLAQATEFASLGLLSGLVAAASASVIASVIAQQVFGLPWVFNGSLLAYGVLSGTVLALLVGLWATRRVTRVSPMQTLRAL
jgi:putative ABC transport system permease protein